MDLPAYQHRPDVYCVSTCRKPVPRNPGGSRRAGLLLLLGALGVTAGRPAVHWPPVAGEPRGLCRGGCFALVTQAVQSLFDFGLCLPANVLLLALFCGAVSAQAPPLPSGLPDAPRSRHQGSRYAPAAESTRGGVAAARMATHGRWVACCC